MTVYEKLAEIQQTQCNCADTQISLIGDTREGSEAMVNRIRDMQYYIDNAYALGLVMDSMPVEIAEREI